MIAPSRFHEVGWRVIQHTATTRFATGSLTDGVALARAIGGLEGAGDRPHLDLRPRGVTVRIVAEVSSSSARAAEKTARSRDSAAPDNARRPDCASDVISRRTSSPSRSWMSSRRRSKFEAT